MPLNNLFFTKWIFLFLAHYTFPPDFLWYRGFVRTNKVSNWALHKYIERHNIKTEHLIEKKSTKWKSRFRVEDTAMWQHILELIVEDLYPTFIIRYVNTKNYKWYFTIIRIEYLLHEWYSNLFQVITPSKEFITQLYFKNDVPPSYEDYIVNRATQFPSSDVRTSSGRNINFNLVIDVWSIGNSHTENSFPW